MKNEPLDDARNVLLIDAAFQMPISNRPHMLHSTNVRGRGKRQLWLTVVRQLARSWKLLSIFIIPISTDKKAAQIKKKLRKKEFNKLGDLW